MSNHNLLSRLIGSLVVDDVFIVIVIIVIFIPFSFGFFRVRKQSFILSSSFSLLIFLINLWETGDEQRISTDFTKSIKVISTLTIIFSLTKEQRWVRSKFKKSLIYVLTSGSIMFTLVGGVDYIISECTNLSDIDAENISKYFRYHDELHGSKYNNRTNLQSISECFTIFERISFNMFILWLGFTMFLILQSGLLLRYSWDILLRNPSSLILGTVVVVLMLSGSMINLTAEGRTHGGFHKFNAIIQFLFMPFMITFLIFKRTDDQVRRSNVLMPIMLWILNDLVFELIAFGTRWNLMNEGNVIKYSITLIVLAVMRMIHIDKLSDCDDMRHID